MSKKRIRAARLYNQQQPLYVLPATAEAYEQMVKQATDECAKLEFAMPHNYVSATLRAIGITAPQASP